MRMLPVGFLLLLPLAARAEAPARPTVVELFTSQGCSSCPPADALLTRLQQADPDVLPLDLHVTYWDRLGWKDPFSFADVTARQRRYSARFGQDSVYTPQLVVDGRYQAIGSDVDAVHQAIMRARAAAAAVPLSLVQEPAGLRVRAGAGPGAARGTLLLVGFDRAHTTPVRGGENGGRTLTEVNVVRALAPAGAWSGQAVDLVAPRPEGERVAVLLQGEDGRILGAATLP